MNSTHVNNQILFVSLIIPTYNRCAFLQTTLEAISRQSYPPDSFEIIVVDDGSTDGTMDYLKNSVKCKNLRVISQKHGGAAAARNTGSKLAKGEILLFTDDDCLPDPDWLVSISNEYKTEIHEHTVAVGGPIRNAPTRNWLNKFYAIQGIRHSANNQESPKYLDTANASFRKDILLEVGGFNEKILIGHDEDLSYRFIEAGYSLRTTSDGIVWHFGRSTVGGMIKEAYSKGFGVATLMMIYPSKFAEKHRDGFSFRVNNFINFLMKLTLQTPVRVRKIAFPLAATFRRFGFVIADIIPFFSNYLPTQIKKFRSAGEPGCKIICFVFLEWVDYLARNLGQIIGTLVNTYQLDDKEKALFMERILLNPSAFNNSHRGC